MFFDSFDVFMHVFKKRFYKDVNTFFNVLFCKLMFLTSMPWTVGRQLCCRFLMYFNITASYADCCYPVYFFFYLITVKSNQIYLLKTSHLRVAIDKTVDEQGRQGSKEHLQ